VQFPTQATRLSDYVTIKLLLPLQLGGPFGFCAFALLSSLLLGSLEIALKRTRPCQRIYVIGRYSMPDTGMCQEVICFTYYLIQWVDENIESYTEIKSQNIVTTN
jgi:hypothetical protein